MDEDKKKDEKQGEDQEKSSDSETKKDEDIENSSQTDDELIDELLADGTSKKKEIRVSKEKFDEKNDKSKLLDELSPLLSKLKERPEIVDELLKSDVKDTLKSRIERLETVEKQKKEHEVREVLGEALKMWPDMKDFWENMRPIVSSLEQQGFSYQESVERAYYATNPQALEKERKSIAQTKANEKGIFNSKGSQGATFHKKEEEDLSFMTDADREFFTKAGIDLKIAAKPHNRKVFEKFKDL